MSSRYDNYIYDRTFMNLLEKKKSHEELNQLIYRKSSIDLILEINRIYYSLIETIQSMKMAEYFYYEAKQALVDQMHNIMGTENYAHGHELSDHLDTCVEEIKRICKKDTENVARLLEITGIAISDIEREYIFSMSANRTEISFITGIKIIYRFLRY